MQIGEIVAKYRKAKGLTQEELAAKVNVSRNTIARLEFDTKTPSFEVMAQIANVLECPLDEFGCASRKGGG